MKVKSFDNQIIEVNLPAEFADRHLLALPALIDPHVHFRTPGAEHKEDWRTGAAAAFAGGITTVFDMPNNTPSIIDHGSLQAKKNIIDQQLADSGLPLKYHLYLGATPTNFTEFEKIKNEIIGVKLFMGASTGDLLVDSPSDQEKIFERAAQSDLLIAVHAEDEDVIRLQKSKFENPSIADHSRLRPRSAASSAVRRAIALSEKFGTRLYICHVSTSDEIELIRAAKARGVQVYCEVAPHHLFLNQSAYATMGARAQMNPPLRTPEDQTALWQAIRDGVVDTIGTDHAPHTLEEKSKPYPASPSGVPSIENYLALLLNAAREGKITIEKIVELTHDNPVKIFNLPPSDDLVIVDPGLQKTIRDEDQRTKCRWSSYAGLRLTGWPVAVVVDGDIYL